MMWQLVRSPQTAHGFPEFAATHFYTITQALDKLSILTKRPRATQPVFLLVDGLDKLGISIDEGSRFRQAVAAVSAAVRSHQFVVGAIAAILSRPIAAVFGFSQQERVFLRPPLLTSPELVVPDGLVPATFVKSLKILRNDMGGQAMAARSRSCLMYCPRRVPPSL
jgi:hypothetical protein